VLVEKTSDGKESLKITIKAPTLGGQAQAKITEETVQQPEATQQIRPVHAISQTSSTGGRPTPLVRPVSYTSPTGLRVLGQQRIFKPKSLEKGKWKTDERSSQYKKFRAKPTFDLLLNKYTRQVTVLKNWPREKQPRSPLRQEMVKMQQREDTQRKEKVQHPLVASNVSQAANHPTGANPAFYPPFFPMAPYVDQPMPYMPPLQQLQYLVWDPHIGMWVQYPPMPMPPFHPGWGAPQGLVFDRFKLPVHDRLGHSQSGLEKRTSQHPHRAPQIGLI
jgi:hypothetical protein